MHKSRSLMVTGILLIASSVFIAFLTIIFMIIVSRDGIMVLVVYKARIDIVVLALIIMCTLPILYLTTGIFGIARYAKPEKTGGCIRLGIAILIIHTAIIILMSIEGSGISIPVVMLLCNLPVLSIYLNAALSLKAMIASAGTGGSDEGD